MGDQGWYGVAVVLDKGIYILGEAVKFYPEGQGQSIPTPTPHHTHALIPHP